MKSIIIGKGNLIVKAVEILHEEGCEVSGVISNDSNIVNWCKKEGIESIRYNNYDDIKGYVQSKSYDYLFSIVNNVLLKQDIIDSAQKGAINFHDSPLPRYAGANATTWAILENEQQHAVTWHQVALDYDNGDILEQEFFEIGEKDTAFSLNAKCFEHALITFHTLVKKIKSNCILAIPQKIKERTYISRKYTDDLKNKELWYVGYITDQMTNGNIMSLYRALNFKTYENPLAKMKILYGNETYIIGQAEPVAAEGTIDIDTNLICGEIFTCGDGIVVKTLDGYIRLSEIQNIKGIDVDCQKEFNISNKVFIPKELADKIRCFDCLIAAKENLWVKEISKISKEENPFNISISQKGKIFELKNSDNNTFSEIVFKFGMYIAYMQGSSQISISLKTEELIEELENAYSLFQPFNYDVSENSLIDIEKKLKAHEERRTFSLDIFQRYEEIRHINLPKIKISKDSSKKYEDQLLTCESSTNIELLYNSSINKLSIFLNFPEELNYEKVILTHLNAILKSDQTFSLSEINSVLNDNTLINKWNRTEVPYNFSGSYIDVFKDIVNLYSTSIAIEFNNEALSYQDLDELSNQIANYLMKKGVKKGQTVSLLFRKNINMVATILAVLKLGAVYVPIDEKYPQDRIEYMIQDSESKLIITDSSSKESFERLERLSKIIDIKDAKHYILSQSKELMSKESVYSDDIAYIIYTSGTTGRPKGVLVKHKGLNNLQIAQSKLFGFKSSDRVLQFSSLSFDASIWEMSLALNVGGTIVLCDSDTVHPGEELSRFIQEQSITVISLPPSVINTLYDKWQYEQLHTIISGSETCWMSLIQKWSNKVRFFNGYGPTEATVCVSFKEYIDEEKIVTIGKPITNTELIILNDKKEPVAIGKTGEIYISGAGIALGYLKRPELTNDKFVNINSKKYYRSGDVGRFTPTGDIEFIGRIDNQVKIRGFRIELDEIEKIALESGLLEMASCILSGENKDKKLLLYYINKGSIAVEKDLRNFIKQKLPSHMIPAYFIEVSEFPTLPNGKLDKKGLLQIKPFKNKKNIAPRNNIEEQLSIIWSNLLKIKNIGVKEDFFEVGGDSLLALEIVVSLEEDYGIKVPVSSIFENSTIEKLASYIMRKANTPFVPLINLKTYGSKNPIFAVHPGDGNVFCYTDLVRALDEDQPFYGFQAYGVELGTTALGSIEEMAAAYIKEMKKVQDNGPYIICGYCAGGTIAFEMAQQLVANGEEVQQLILLDARAPHTYTPIDETQNFINFARNFEGISNRDIFALYSEKHGVEYTEEELYNLIKSQDFETRINEVWQCSQKLDILPSNIEAEYLKRLFNVWQGLGGMNTYEVKPYPGNILLYYAEDDSINKVLKFEYLGWEKANPSLERRLISGNHFSCIKSPLVEKWAKDFL